MNLNIVFKGMMLSFVFSAMIGCTKSPGKLVASSYTEIFEKGTADILYDNIRPSDKIYSKEKVSELVQSSYKMKKSKGLTIKNVEMIEEKINGDVADVKLKYIEINEKTKTEKEYFITIKAEKIDGKWYVIPK